MSGAVKQCANCDHMGSDDCPGLMHCGAFARVFWKPVEAAPIVNDEADEGGVQ